jgi:DNA-directed RNA polymerase specialized sigma24 family protein
MIFIRSLDPSLLRLVSEEHLVRLVLAGFGPAPAVLLYLYNICLGWPTERMAHWLLDVPLHRLFAHCQKKLAARKALSPLSVASYLMPLEARLELTCAEFAHKTCQPPLPGLEPHALLGTTTLRHHFGDDPARLACAVVAIADRVLRLPFDWRDPRVFEIFCTARQQDLLSFFLKAANGNSDDAADLAQESWVKVLEALPDYDRQRASFIAFTMHKAKYVRHAYFCDRKRRALCEPMDDELVVSPEIRRLLDGLDPAVVDEIHLETLGWLLQSRRPPHQVLAFILCKVLKYPPHDVIAKLGHKTLRLIARMAEIKILAASNLPPDAVRAAFKGFRDRLAKRVGDLVKGQKKRRELSPLLAQIAGDTRLCDYYPDDSLQKRAEGVTADWNAAHKRLYGDTLKQASGALRELLDEEGISAKNPPRFRKSSPARRSRGNGKRCPTSRQRRKKSRSKPGNNGRST